MRAAFVLLMLAAFGMQGALAAGRVVDLKKPGAMDRLKHDNPAHYQAVRAILDNVVEQPDGVVEEWIRVTYEAEDVGYSPFLLATDPPKRDLSFRLDDVLYHARVTLPHGRPVVRPALAMGRDRRR